MSQLFTPYEVKGVTLKNRIVMSPMCMYSSMEKDGMLTEWHKLHYATRAAGQVGLIITEATSVHPDGRISSEDLGLWNDQQIQGYAELAQLIHAQDTRIGIQLAHAGRKVGTEQAMIAPSAIAFSEKHRVPEAMSLEQIQRTIEDFAAAAKRSLQAGLDVIEIHAAHGYLINEFLSPLSNKREDSYGGSEENRYRILGEIIDAIHSEWSGPLFVRISANDYHVEGLNTDDYIRYAARMKKQGVDLVDCSSGGVVPTPPTAIFPGYQVSSAERIRREAAIATGAVGLITSPSLAEEIICNGRADLVFLGRTLLANPYWAHTAAKELAYPLVAPRQYTRGW
ncbi:MAG: NADPH dehydrogenase NamA [Gorillibacterium sp.]|nr:NADPH dehydrogenase NamA [Gorillibacterium sp.]